MDVQKKDWKKLFKRNKIVLNPKNVQTRKIDGEDWHFFVVQSKKAGNDPFMCPLGFVFDESTYAVSGHIYMFANRDLRDEVFKFVTTGWILNFIT